MLDLGKNIPKIGNAPKMEIPNQDSSTAHFIKLLLTKCVEGKK